MRLYTPLTSPSRLLVWPPAAIGHLIAMSGTLSSLSRPESGLNRFFGYGCRSGPATSAACFAACNILNEVLLLAAAASVALAK